MRNKTSKLLSILLLKYDYGKGSALFQTTSYTCSNAREGIQDKSIDLISAEEDSRGLMGKQIVPNDL